MPMYSGSNPYQKAVSGSLGPAASGTQGIEQTTTPPINQFTGKSDLFKGVSGLGLQRRADEKGGMIFPVENSGYLPGYGQAAGVALSPVGGGYGLLSQNRNSKELKEAISGNDSRLSGGARALSIGNNAVMTNGLSLIGFL